MRMVIPQNAAEKCVSIAMPLIARFQDDSPTWLSRVARRELCSTDHDRYGWYIMKSCHISVSVLDAYIPASGEREIYGLLGKLGGCLYMPRSRPRV